MVELITQQFIGDEELDVDVGSLGYVWQYVHRADRDESGYFSVDDTIQTDLPPVTYIPSKQDGLRFLTDLSADAQDCSIETKGSVGVELAEMGRVLQMDDWGKNELAVDLPADLDGEIEEGCHYLRTEDGSIGGSEVTGCRCRRRWVCWEADVPKYQRQPCQAEVDTSYVKLWEPRSSE